MSDATRGGDALACAWSRGRITGRLDAIRSRRNRFQTAVTVRYPYGASAIHQAPAPEHPMAELKTKPTTVSVSGFLDAVHDEERRKACFAVAKIMKKVTGADRTMWGPSIVGFGDHRADASSAGFSPASRRASTNSRCTSCQGSIVTTRFWRSSASTRTGKSCLYIKRLADVDLKVLEALVESSVKQMRPRG